MTVTDCVSTLTAPGQFTSVGGKFQPNQTMGLLGNRYKFIEVLGRGQSSVFIRAEVHIEEI